MNKKEETSQIATVGAVFLVVVVVVWVALGGGFWGSKREAVNPTPRGHQLFVSPCCCDPSNMPHEPPT